LKEKLTLATQKLETKLETNERKYSAKVKACSAGKVKLHEDWSKLDTEAKKFKNTRENFARSVNTEAHKRAKESETKMLNEASKDKETAKEEAEETYQLDIETANRQYEKTIKVNDEKLRNKLQSNIQKLEANKRMYGTKANACLTDKNTASDEWYKKDAEAKSNKIESENVARSANTKAQKIAQETKENKLNAANKDKELKIKEAKDAYQLTVKRIDKDYQDTVNASSDKLEA